MTVNPHNTVASFPFLSRYLGLTLMLTLSACGGHQSSPATAGNKAAFTQEVDGTPGWLRRGGAAVKTKEKRVFYGVGMASGIRNPAMLRTTVDNRARADLAKVFKTYSASLMKDFQSATTADGKSVGESQAIEQAIKTYSANTLKGVQIVDHYVHKDGSLYALAKLDFNTADTVAALERAGVATSSNTTNELDDIFDQGSKKVTAAENKMVRAVATNGNSNTQNTPHSSRSSSDATVRSGSKPAWVTGSDNNWPHQKWLCAVGFSAERGAAEAAGYSALSRLFEAHVKSVSNDFMGAYSKTGAQSIETQSSETLTQISTEKVFSGVKVAEVWSGEGQVFALSCMERGPAKRALLEQMNAAEQTTTKLLEQAKRADKAKRAGALKKALDTIMQRAAFNAELRIIDADGIGAQGLYSHVDIAAAFEAAIDALKIGVSAQGPHNEELRSAIIAGLTSRGYKVTDGAAVGNDLEITAKITLEDGGKGTGRAANIHFARGLIDLTVKNISQDKVVASLHEERKEGHRSLSEAERRVIQKLGKKLSGKLAAKIEKLMLR